MRFKMVISASSASAHKSSKPSRSKNYILAHDLGTTGNKATLYDREGLLIGSTFHPYPTFYPNVGWAEQDADDWWQAVCATTHSLLAQTGISSQEIACIVFSGQMMGCTPLDRHARPLRRAIIWADQRAINQERRIAERIPPDEVYRITGHRVSASYSLCKILWLREHCPEVYRAAHKFMHAKDTVIARLTGTFVTDPSDASGMNLFDLEHGTWSEPIIRESGIDPAQLPEVRQSNDIAGEVIPQAADEVGVPSGTPVVVGGGDGPCAAAGAGVVREGGAYNYIGSSSWIAIASRKPVYDPHQRTFTFAHVIPHMFMPTGTMQAAGASYQWARDQLCAVETLAAQLLETSPYELMNAQAERSTIGANGLLFLPYLLGERSPRWNPLARGAFIGLTIRHTHADMIRAILEGVTLNLRIILDVFREQGVAIEAVRLIGGGARGRFWNQLMANVYGLPVHRLAVLEEATSMGAAMVGGVAVGIYPDFDTMASQMNRIAETFEPDATATAAYGRLLPLFEAAYTALVPLYEALAQWGP